MKTKQPLPHNSLCLGPKKENPSDRRGGGALEKQHPACKTC